METKNKEVGFVVSYVDRKTRKRVGFLGPSKLRNALRVSCTRNQQEVVRYSSVCLSFRFFLYSSPQFAFLSTRLESPGRKKHGHPLWKGRTP